MHTHPCHVISSKTSICAYMRYMQRERFANKRWQWLAVLWSCDITSIMTVTWVRPITWRPSVKNFKSLCAHPLSYIFRSSNTYKHRAMFGCSILLYYIISSKGVTCYLFDRRYKLNTSMHERLQIALRTPCHISSNQASVHATGIF